MRIGVNARRLEGQPLGVARYIEYLLGYWAEMLHDESGASSTSASDWRRAAFRDGPFETEVLRPKLRGFMWENVRLAPRHPWRRRLLRPELLAAARPPAGPTVVMIHSVNEVQEGTHPWWYPYTFTNVYRASARKADRVIVPSPVGEGRHPGGVRDRRRKDRHRPAGGRRRIPAGRGRSVLRQTRIEQARRGPAVRGLRREALAAAQHPDADRAFAELAAAPPRPPATSCCCSARTTSICRSTQLARDLGIGDRVVQTDGRPRSTTTTSRASTAPPTPTSAHRPTRASRSPWSRRWRAGRP